MNTEILYGYGFALDDCKVKDFVQFITNHKNTFCKTPQEYDLLTDLTTVARQLPNVDLYLDDIEDMDIFQNYADQVTGQTGAGAIISNIMHRETNIQFQFVPPCSDTMEHTAILLARCYPWEYNAREKALTEEKLIEILQGYMKELGINTDPDTMSVEYNE